MSESASIERQKILEARGAEIVLTPSRLGSDGAIEEAYRMARENPDLYFNVDQYNNDANWKAHYHGTANEILEQTGGKVSVFVAALGTGGTLMGTSRRMKEVNPLIEIVGVEPFQGHKIQGLKNMKESYPPGIYDKKRIDTIINIGDEEAFETARQLARKEGLLVGMSSGAAMAGAIAVAKRIDRGTIVVVFPDSGERYLSTALFLPKIRRGTLKVLNTLTQKKELFKPNKSESIGIYSCGPTVHGRIHLGEARRFVFSDLLCRYLEFSGYKVNHVMNITDLDDKIIEASEKAHMDMDLFTEENIIQFKKDLDLLGIRDATKYPLASLHVEEMISLADKIIENGFGYEKLRSVYFDVSKLPSYGRLSGVDLDKMNLGTTVDLDDYEKEDPRDFTLLKRVKLNELKKGIYYSTKWGNVRPSWHIQCPAMAMKYLSENFDIHTSARHLIFPHHENEIAIAEAVTGKLLANYWMHCGPVMFEDKEVDEKKRFLTVEFVLKMGFSERELRYWLLSSNYQRSLPFSRERLLAKRKSLKRVDDFIQALLNVENADNDSVVEDLAQDTIDEFTKAMDDDLNISVALASIFKTVRKGNNLIQKMEMTAQAAENIINAFKKIDAVLNVFSFDPPFLEQDTQVLMDRRNALRKGKDWEAADQIRVELENRGIEINDLGD
ncbi:CysS1 [Desulforapulum autotrophicum HRM2]|uniref:Cysteine--tRNA ligase n=2 Tax=Desulforapulum autotrophicum TaxID=2296 RepID=C0QCN7_DESAH|nr:CysS1 [Desulforapulum autotrophicum HRM2]